MEGDRRATVKPPAASNTVVPPTPSPSEGATANRWAHRTGTIVLDGPTIMGILNATPDSFSDGGRYLRPERAVERARRMIDEGADIVDVGGESTRPGAQPVSQQEELDRVIPVIEAIRADWSVPISIDTRRSTVARHALDVGADIVNDVSALADPEMARVVAETGAGIVLMHMRGTPETMQDDPRYDDVARDVANELGDRMHCALGAGVESDRIVLDPGIGFGKRIDHNLELIARLDVLSLLGRPIMLGVSRKAFIGSLLGGAPADRRAVGTAAACVFGLLKGARIFRVHDIATTHDALRIADALRKASPGAVDG